ncbi:MAG: polysaccharide biosynthesis protein, partial [Pseudomonadota bacterium]
DSVILAIPSISEERRQAIGELLEEAGAKIRTVPSLVDMVTGQHSSDEIMTLTPERFLGREEVDLNLDEVNRAYAGKTVLVTGAGGSIGAELCRQLMNCGPAKLVLFELTEFALYQIDRDLSSHSQSGIVEVVPCLGSVCDRDRLMEVIKRYGVDTILHAAAYKHVPLVEA